MVDHRDIYRGTPQVPASVRQEMASWNIKSEVRPAGRSRRTEEKEEKEKEVRGLIASLPLRYRRHHVMFTWGQDTTPQDTTPHQDDWKMEEPDNTSRYRREKENQPRRSNKNPNKKMKRRFFQGSLTNLTEDGDVRNKSIKSAANHINQIRPSANSEHDNLCQRVRPQPEDPDESHKYLLDFLRGHNHTTTDSQAQLYKSLSNPELERSVEPESQSRYVFPVSGRHYDVVKMEKYLEKKKRSREEFPLGEVAASQPSLQQERELETCEIVPDQLEAGLLY